MAKINSTIPEFSTQAFVPGQDDFVTITSDDVKGQWSIFLFYPADFTFVCPTELEDMQNIYGELQQLGVQVYSVSTDSHFVLKRSVAYGRQSAK
jgi:peroxiredoxin (alkyl hydroperoxide reductase subunit C)